MYHHHHRFRDTYVDTLADFSFSRGEIYRARFVPVMRLHGERFALEFFPPNESSGHFFLSPDKKILFRQIAEQQVVNQPCRGMLFSRKTARNIAQV